jgi:hypothetical protein
MVYTLVVIITVIRMRFRFQGATLLLQIGEVPPTRLVTVTNHSDRKGLQNFLSLPTIRRDTILCVTIEMVPAKILPNC